MTVPEITCDVLVAGAGAGGMATAAVAADLGLDVIVAEKTPVFGGSTAFSAGVIWVPDNRFMRDAGMDDSAERAMSYLEREVGNRLNRDVAAAYLREAPVMHAWFEDNTHVAFDMQPKFADYHPDVEGAALGGRALVPRVFEGRKLGRRFRDLRAPISTTMAFGGMMIARQDFRHMFRIGRSVGSTVYAARLIARYGWDRLRYPRGTRLSNGNALAAMLALSLFDREVPIWLSSPIAELTHVDGQVTGAVVDRDGEPVRVAARTGVVLAAGGFPGDEALKARVYPHLAEGRNHHSLPPTTSSGDGLRLGQAAGAGMAEDAANAAAWAPTSLVPQKDGSTLPFPHFIDRAKPGVIVVDRRGRRFTNEANSYHDFVPPMIEACEGDETIEVYIVADHRAIRRYGLGPVPPFPGRLGPWLKSGYLVRGETPEDLGSALGIDGSALAATLAAFNGPAASGDDPAFGKGTNAYNWNYGDVSHTPNPCVAPLDQAPFYAIRMIPGDIGTFLGLRADASARVLDGDGQPIPGLYVAGNDMVSVMGGTYPGAGITIGPAMTFGYIAARHMAGVKAANET